MKLLKITLLEFRCAKYWISTHMFHVIFRIEGKKRIDKHSVSGRGIVEQLAFEVNFFYSLFSLIQKVCLRFFSISLPSPFCAECVRPNVLKFMLVQSEWLWDKLFS